MGRNDRLTWRTTKRYLSLGVIMISYFFVRMRTKPSSSCQEDGQWTEAKLKENKAQLSTYRLVEGLDVLSKGRDARLDQVNYAFESLCPLFGAGTCWVEHSASASYDGCVVAGKHQTSQHARTRRQPDQRSFNLSRRTGSRGRTWRHRTLSIWRPRCR